MRPPNTAAIMTTHGMPLDLAALAVVFHRAGEGPRHRCCSAIRRCAVQHHYLAFVTLAFSTLSSSRNENG